jgi:hypothetical protein
MVSGALPADSTPKLGFVRKVVLCAGGVPLLLLGLFVIFTPISWRSSRLTEAYRSAEALEQKLKQHQGQLDVSLSKNLEDEIIRLARERLEQTRRSYSAAVVSLIEVEEAEGELALAEARGDQLKRAEARLTIATKYLERIEKVFRTGNIGGRIQPR